MNRFAKKLIQTLIVIIITGLFPTSLVMAQSIPGVGSVSVPVFNATELTAKTAQTAAINLVLNNPADAAALALIGRGDAACKGLDRAEQIVSTSDSVSDFSLIGESPVAAANLEIKIAALAAVQKCREVQLAAVLIATPISVGGAENFAKKQNDLTAEIASLKLRQTSLSAQKDATIKDILKAIMVRIILNLNKSLTTELVNKMQEKYKISDYLAYGNAVATDVYNVKYINENYSGQPRDQMMIRALLQSQKLPSQVVVAQNYANVKAKEYLGQACDVGIANNTAASAQSDAYFANCLAAYGSPAANPAWHMDQAWDKAQATTTAGKVMAAQEISQSNGYAPARDCQGTVSQQTQIDEQYKTAAQNEKIETDTIALLRQTLAAAADDKKAAIQAQIDIAQKRADQATANRKALEQQEGDPLKDICKAITSPAQFIATSLEGLLKSHFEQSYQLQGNLPFLASFGADIASNFLTNILTGGKSSGQVLKEGGIGALNGSLIGLNQAASGGGVIPGGSTGTTAKTGLAGVKIVAIGSDGAVVTSNLIAGREYTIQVDFTGNSDLFTTNHLTITLNGGATGSMDIPTNGTHVVKIGYTYTPTAGTNTVNIGFWDGLNKSNSLGTATQSFTVTAAPAAGGVAGASTIVSSEPFWPRGPAVLSR